MSDGGDEIQQVYEPPNDEQLVNFVAVLTLGLGASDADKEAVRAMLEIPFAKKTWLARHRSMQEAAWQM